MFKYPAVCDILKVTVQRQLTWFESGINGWKLLHCMVGHFSFYVLKGHHHKMSIKQFSASSQLLN